MLRLLRSKNNGSVLRFQCEMRSELEDCRAQECQGRMGGLAFM